MFLRLFENIFGYFVERRNNSFDLNRIKQYRGKIPVISIGNISVGGSGKTPLTIELAKLLLERGIRPAVIGRGYKRKSSGGIIVSDGKQILSSAEEAGDEMLLIAQKLNVPVVLHQKKYEAARIVEENFNVDVILLDDGFQHRKLHRNLDIVILDTKTIEKPYLLPRGRLREPLKSILRADIICLYSENDYKEIAGLIGNDSEVFYISVKKDGIYNLEKYNPVACYSELKQGKFNEINFCENLNDNEKKFATLSSIANPERFFNSIKEVHLAHSFIFQDHHQYSENDILKIIKCCKNKNINSLITTEKDAVKLYRFNGFFKSNSIFIYVFSIKIDILNFQKLTDFVLRTIDKT
ncbi:MAG TPA: tetraacyldisaccharide 4'-kinase [Candidatus Kapabacteria bacterium]|nr:tetraacyldisaccharide 4'-kinase [Candidatus Kapabacteria bacterium]